MLSGSQAPLGNVFVSLVVTELLFWKYSRRHALTLSEVNLKKVMSNPGPGTTGNVLAAICSVFIPGLGQLVQGRIFMALVQFVLAGILWIFLLGWLVHLWSIIDAALYRGR